MGGKSRVVVLHGNHHLGEFIEFAGIEVIDGVVGDERFHVYLSPSCNLNDEVIIRTGITPDFLLDKPDFSTVQVELKEFVSDSEIIVYDNVIYSVLMDSFEHLGIRLVNGVAFVKDLAKSFLKKDSTLKYLFDKFHIKNNGYDYESALSTCEMLSSLYLTLLDNIKLNLFNDELSFNLNQVVTIYQMSDLDRFIDSMPRSTLFRGVSNKEYTLVPSLFRHKEIDNIDKIERDLMWFFKTQAKPYLNLIPKTDLDWLVVAQHHGLPTRLLDWSLSPLVACFFAVNDLSDTDGAIFIYNVKSFRKEEAIDVHNLREITAFMPSHSTKRIAMQSGFFTIHPTSKIQLNDGSISKLIIPSERKRYFLDRLSKYGVHHGTIYPDLDGLSAYIKYLKNY
ncbi:FRG domain-containing protein [Aeromonas salmonicida]|uniref:FRG domain-containing protein n=1 Tax=Aeromonas salmonicida TaxID=645 RepID=UPI003CF6AB62